MMNQDPYIGQQIGNYRLVEKLACGFFGCVYRAEHLYLRNRVVAIKLLHAHLASQKQRDSFIQEAQFLEALKHPYILPIIDMGIHNGFPYLMVEYSSEGSLRKRLSLHPNPVAIEEAITIITQIGEALQFAHDHNIVHRDLKPENILFNAKGEVLLADFGIAVVLEMTRRVDDSGTPPYMAPEQFQGIISKKSDQYALGCIAYELFTRSRPFTLPRDAHPAAWANKHMTENPALPTTLVPLLPMHIEQAILRAIAKKHDDRYADITSFTTALRKSAKQWLDEGNALYIAKQHEKALVAYEQAIRLNPNFAEAYTGKGKALNKLKRYGEALAAFEQAIRLLTTPNFAGFGVQLNRNDAEAFSGKGNALYRMGRYEEALAAFEEAIHLLTTPNFAGFGVQLNRNDAEAFSGKGNALYRMGRYEEALTAYEQAIRLDPNDAGAYNGKGDVLCWFGRNEEALVAFEEAIRLDPNDARAYNGKGNVLSWLRRYEEALTAYEQAIRLDPNDAMAYNSKGLVLEQLGRKREAQQAYEKARQLTLPPWLLS